VGRGNIAGTKYPLEPWESSSRAGGLTLRELLVPHSVFRFLIFTTLSTQDLELVRGCIAGMDSAWDEFVRRTRSAIYRGAAVAFRKFGVSDPESIENVFQQVYVELLRDGNKALRGFRGESDLEGWVAVIAMRTAYGIMRRKTPLSSLPDLLPDTAAPAPGETAERTEFLDRLDAAFRRLDPRDTALLRLSYYENMSYKDIAAALGLPLNSVSPLLIRAKEKLKKYLE
jgi:RNA polymerase sigma-70 factor (ECF subfamily)